MELLVLWNEHSVRAFFSFNDVWSKIHNSNKGMNFLTIAKHLLRDLKVEGCTIPEIVDLEKELNIYLPESYKEFLMWMGKGTNKFLRGSEVEYKHLIKIQGWANELLEESGHALLPDNSFVFHIHQGYQFSYFLLDEGDNPTVYFYDETISNKPGITSETFSQWLATEAQIFTYYKQEEDD